MPSPVNDTTRDAHNHQNAGKATNTSGMRACRVCQRREARLLRWCDGGKARRTGVSALDGAGHPSMTRTSRTVDYGDADVFSDRHGYLTVHGFDEPIEAVLTRDFRGLRVCVPLGTPEGPQAAWFTRDVKPRRQGAPTTPRRTPTPVPREMQFRSPQGHAALVDCIEDHDDEYSGGWPRSGYLRPAFAAFSTGHHNYSTINGLSTIVPELSHWMGLRQAHVQAHTDDRGSSSAFVLLEAMDPVPVLDSMGLVLRPGWDESSSYHEGLRVRPRVMIETRTASAIPWRRHVFPHTAIINLLTIAVNRTCGVEYVVALRDDDPDDVFSDGIPRPSWKYCHTGGLAWSEDVDRWRRDEFMFSYHDIGAEGIREWLTLAAECPRGIEPLVAIVQSPGIDRMTLGRLSGIVLEGLGHYACPPTTRRAPQGHRGTRGYLSALAAGITDLPFDRTEWAARSARVHSAFTTVGAALPDPVDVEQTFAENVFVARAWIAHQLCKRVEDLSWAWKRNW